MCEGVKESLFFRIFSKWEFCTVGKSVKELSVISPYNDYDNIDFIWRW